MANSPRSKASDFDPEVLRLFDQYVHGAIDRRGFLAGAARFAVGATGAATLLAALSPQFAAAQQVKPDDKRLSTRYVEFSSPKGYGKARGYLAQPARAKGPLPSCWWCTRTGASIRISKTSRAGWRWRTSSPSPRMRCFRWADIRATRMRRGRSS